MVRLAAKIPQLIGLVCAGLGAALPLTTEFGWAQPTETPSISISSPVVTATTPSQSGITVPSLWWAREQFGSKLLDNWIAYPSQGDTPSYVDLLVRQEVWNTLDYLERYTFVNQFGFVASDYGYNLRVFDRQQNLLATYTCNFSKANPNYLKGIRDFQGQPVPDYVSSSTALSDQSKEPTCQIGLRPSSVVTLKSRPIQRPGSSTTGNGIGQP